MIYTDATFAIITGAEAVHEISEGLDGQNGASLHRRSVKSRNDHSKG